MKHFSLWVILLMALAAATGCSESGTSSAETPDGTVTSRTLYSDYNPADFSAAMKSEGAVILDVRTPAEVAEGYIPGAVFIDWNSPNFETQVQKLGSETPVYVYCAVGGRSAGAKELLQDLGFVEVHNLLGGIEAWKGAGMEVAK